MTDATMYVPGALVDTDTRTAFNTRVSARAMTSPIATAHALREHQSDNVPGSRAHRQPHANLLRPLVHAVCHDCVETDRGDEQRQAGENREQRAHQSIEPVVAEQPLLHGPQVVDWDVGV